MLSNCKKVLEKTDIGAFTASQVYNDSITTKLSIDYLYGQNQPGWFGNSGGSISGTLNTLADEQYGDNVYVRGTATIESVTDIGVANSTSNAYGKIRQLNMFIRDVNAGTLDPAVKRRYAAQAYFWRAYRYFELVKLYGGVPLVLTPLDEVGDDARKAALIPRSQTSKVFAQISADLDSGIKYLPTKWPNTADYGRLTSCAAAAMKSRVTLTWASPQFNPTHDNTRWQTAFDVASQAISLCNGIFSLYPKFDVTMWTTERNVESVLVTEYNTTSTDNGANNNTYPTNTIPKTVGGTGGSNQPTWDMARAFLMKDGKDTLTSKYAYSAQTFYKNRDPRFDQTIAYNGALWPVLGNSTQRLWTYYYSAKDKNNNVVQTSTEIGGAGTTGLYLRKAIDPALNSASLPTAGTDWIEIRYAEILLNQAEAAAELGRLGTTQEAYANVIAVRKRAGIEAGADNLYGLTTPLTSAQMVDVIMKERQVEFAFEGKRYWDLRRRKLLESTLNNKRRMGVVITLANNNSYTDYIANTRDASASTSLDALYASSFTVKTKSVDTYNIAVQTADYFFGIPTNALLNNSALLQNNTWGGTFDPLQ
ncbi:RagB/SusD family nutrient uptake outer membrane protein [Mucilaginibacter boryungensis]